MAASNKVILLGRWSRDPEVRYTQDAKPIARGTLAVNRRFTSENGQTADFINVVAFGKTAEFIEKYTQKGTKLLVEGRIQTGSYTNKEGQKIYTTDVVIESAEFAESKGAQENRNSAPAPAPAVDDFINIPEGIDEELPFA